jgi:hypothetical protein
LADSPDAPLLSGGPDAEPPRRKLGLGEPLHHVPGQPGDSGPAMPLQRRADPSPTPPAAPPSLGLGPPLGSSAPRASVAGAAPPMPPSEPAPPLPLAAPPTAGTPPDGTASAPGDESSPTEVAGEVFTATTPPDPGADGSAPLVGGLPAAPPSPDVSPSPEAPTGDHGLGDLPLQRWSTGDHPNATGGPPRPPTAATAPPLVLRSLTRAAAEGPMPHAVAPLLGWIPPALSGGAGGGLGPVAQRVAAASGAPAQAGGTTAEPGAAAGAAPLALGTAALGTAPLGTPPLGTAPLPVQTATLRTPPLPPVFRPASGGVTPGSFAAPVPPAGTTTGALPLGRPASPPGTAVPGGAPATRAAAAVQRLATESSALPLHARQATPAMGHDSARIAAMPPAAAGDGPLLQRSRPEAPTPEATAPQGLDALFVQGAARPDGPNGVAFTQPAGPDGPDDTVGGAGESGEQGTSGEEPLGHPRTWSAEVLEELSRRLYAGISRRMKQELRTDRERAGRLMDLRR